MSKLIIQNDSNISDQAALMHVITMLQFETNEKGELGTVSFTDHSKIHHVKNKHSDRFVIQDFMTGLP